MNEIAVFTGSLTIYWSSIIICLGIAAGLSLTLALYPVDHRHNTAVWVWFPITTVLGVLLFKETLSFPQVVCILLIAGGIAGLKILA